MSAANGFLATQSLIGAAELDLFTLLWPEPRSAAEVCERLVLPRRSGEVLLAACAALGLLEERAGGFRTRPEHAPYLVRSETEEHRVTDWVIRVHHRDLYRQLADPVAVLRQERQTILPYTEGYTADPRAVAFHAYMDMSIRAMVKVFLETWPLAGRTRVLDLFGGHGLGCRAMVAATPGLRGSFMDLPEVIAGAPEGSGGVTGLGGDIFGAPLPTGFDAITVFRTVHDLDDEHAALLTRRAFEALAPGGELIVIERMLVDSGAAEDLELRMRDLAFLAVGPIIRYRAPSDYQRMFAAAGFERVDTRRAARAPHLFYRGMHVVAGRKA